MAEGGDNERMMRMRGMGRTQMLWQAIQDIWRRREEGQESSSPPIPACRVGIVPWDLMGRSHGPQSTCVGKGRGFPPSSPPHPGGRGRGRPLPPHLPRTPLPTV